MAMTSLVDYYSDLWDIQNRLLVNGQVDITANYSINEELERLIPYRTQILEVLDVKQAELNTVNIELDRLIAQYDAAILPADKDAALVLVTAKQKEKSQLQKVIFNLENHTTLARYDQLINSEAIQLQVYEIDLFNKIINGPNVFGVVNDKCSQDHFFCFDRYFDNVDLTTKVCLIHFENVKEEQFYLPIKEYDITTLADENKIIIKVNLPQKMFVKEGIVNYTFNFYTIKQKIDKNNITKYIPSYNLSLQIASATILPGIESEGYMEYTGYNQYDLERYKCELDTIPNEYQLNWEILS